jgi:hypothetical protein
MHRQPHRVQSPAESLTHPTPPPPRALGVNLLPAVELLGGEGLSVGGLCFVPS